MGKNHKDILVAFIHLALMVFIILLPPLGTYVSTADASEAWFSLKDTFSEFMPIFMIYFINYYLLVPRLYEKRKKWFFAINAVLIILTMLFELWNEGDFDEEFYAPWFYFILILNFITYSFSVSCALAVRTISRLQNVELLLEEQKQRNLEAELKWLKNQLNPHFLFNTLNNISSLVNVDADNAQDSITRLSDLLRYALYESSKPTVPLHEEIAFMENYISLMKLRCSDKVKVEIMFDDSKTDLKIAPMLFISVIENAFKHGVSNHEPSFIRMGLSVTGNMISFTCDNSNFPKKDSQRTGSGVGIENTRRRMDLLYPNRNEYVQTIENDVYHVEIKIMN